MRYVAYYRVSTDKQGRSGLGLEAQREAVRSFLAAKGWPPVAEFTEVESGKKSDRQQLAAALAACRLHKAVLVIAKLDRLARNAAFLLNLRDAGVEFVACDMSDANRLTVGIMALVAEDEAERISARTKAALAAAKARGAVLGGFRGYVPSEDDRAKAAQAKREKAKRLDLMPEVAAIRASGVSSLSGIARALNERGIPTSNGAKWQAVQVKRMLAMLD
ncbi:site-specific recombinase [Paramagnetospirillum caucaseum]|uniref:Site-specific recombinase n=1 Tax=Paramagnetospirillum caucaseum TaxID=1244869 RepID=M3AF47_9PROT|nr:recombinase family protein [Paramagnetospirillum caucaseum]EME71478.1 site-specific recombinase [Paramagnetospirillum caucaseum]